MLGLKQFVMEVFIRFLGLPAIRIINLTGGGGGGGK